MLDWGKCARVSVLARAHTLLSFYFNLYIPTYFTRLLIYFFCFTLKHLHVAKRQIHYRPRHMRYIRIQSPKNNTISIPSRIISILLEFSLFCVYLYVLLLLVCGFFLFLIVVFAVAIVDTVMIRCFFLLMRFYSAAVVVIVVRIHG